MAEYGSWVGTPVRDRSGRMGRVIHDHNNPWTRHLEIRFDDGERYTFRFNNQEMDPPDPMGIEWEFSPREYPGEWRALSDYERTRVTDESTRGGTADGGA